MLHYRAGAKNATSQPILENVEYDKKIDDSSKTTIEKHQRKKLSDWFPGKRFRCGLKHFLPVLNFFQALKAAKTILFAHFLQFDCAKTISASQTDFPLVILKGWFMQLVEFYRNAALKMLDEEEEMEDGPDTPNLSDEKELPVKVWSLMFKPLDDKANRWP
jgi:hypothetical protein